MRDQLAHRYFDTSHAILQATVDNDLLELGSGYTPRPAWWVIPRSSRPRASSRVCATSSRILNFINRRGRCQVMDASR